MRGLPDVTKLQGDTFEFNGRLDDIIFDKKSQLPLLSKHTAEIVQILQGIGWVKEAPIKAARINTRDERVSWALQGKDEPEILRRSKYYENLPYMTLAFPITQDILIYKS